MKRLLYPWLVLNLSIAGTVPLLGSNWPNWRGPDGNGVSTEKNLPLQWSDKENVRWRVDLPEPGNASPIVWDDRVFLAQAIKAENRRTLMCFDLGSGKVNEQDAHGIVWKTLV